MKPRTNLHHQIYNLSLALPKLVEVVKPWAFETCILHRGYRNKTATFCLSCGHVWKSLTTGNDDVCTGCNRKLGVETSRKKKLRQMVYFAALDVRAGFQVNRLFQMFVYQKAGTPPRISCWEIAQQWLQPEGKNEVVARNRGGMGHYMSDNFHGDLEIRDRSTLWDKYNLFPTAIYPKMKVLPIYKRNGFKGKTGPCTPFEIFTHIIKDTKAETLLKVKQYELLGTIIDRSGSVERFWSSIKICIRNNYIVKDGVMWLDYLELLRYFNRDLNSPKYVCPKDLKREHDRLVVKKTAIENLLAIERKKKKIESDEKAYQEAKRAFFGLVFSDGDLTVKVLESVQEFIKESEVHRHCVFSNAYYNKPDSLCFSASINGQPVETVEVSISKAKILQSRGLGNAASKYNQLIVGLLKKNMHMIRKRNQESKKVARMPAKSMKKSA